MRRNPDLEELREYNRQAARRECDHLNSGYGYCGDCQSWISFEEQIRGFYTRGYLDYQVTKAKP